MANPNNKAALYIIVESAPGYAYVLSQTDYLYYLGINSLKEIIIFV